MSKIDLSDIKENDLDKTSSFTDLMSRSERRSRKREKEIEYTNSDNDIEEMIQEKKKSTAELTKELNEAKKQYNKMNNDEELGKTQILDLTRQMKFNFEEQREENIKRSKKGISPLNVIGEVNLLCIGYYIYLLAFTSFQDNRNNYLINGGIIVLLVLLFGLSTVTPKKLRKVFSILNIIALFGFISFNVFTLYF